MKFVQRVTPEEILDVRNQIEIHSSKMDTERDDLKSRLEDSIKQEVTESIRYVGGRWRVLSVSAN